MARIIQDGPVYSTADTELMDGGVRRYRSRGSLVLFLILILIIGWVYTNRGFGSLGFGTNKDTNILGWPAAKQTDTVSVDVNSQVGLPTPVPGATIPPPAAIITAPDITITGPIPDNIEPAPLPALTTQDPDVIGHARTTADQVNVRRGPSLNYRSVLVLPRGWQVLVLRQSHIDNIGEVWIEVSVSTNQGFERGWINQRYLDLT